MSAKTSKFKTKSLISKRRLSKTRGKTETKKRAPKNKDTATNTAATTTTSGKIPDVIVDFEYDKDVLFIVIQNIGDDSAFDIQTKFSKKILGMQKTKDISSLRIFKLLRFLPPAKKIKIPVDLFQFYLLGKQPLQISVNVFFRNKTKQKFQNSINHDLSIYRDIGSISNPGGNQQKLSLPLG